eukprot:39117-Amphidinium_carterae.1
MRAPSMRVYCGKHTPQAIPVLPFEHVSLTKQAPFNVHGNQSASEVAFSHAPAQALFLRTKREFLASLGTHGKASTVAPGLVWVA